MNIWIYYVLLSELMWAVTSFIDKLILSKNYIKTPFVFIIFNGLMNVQLLFLLPFAGFGKLVAIDIALALAAGIFLTLGIIFYYKAVQFEEISRVLMLWQITPIFVLVISFLLLHESLTKNSFIGFIFLLAAGLIVSHKKINGAFKLSKAFYFMLASTFLISIYYLVSAHIYKTTSFWSAFMWLRLSALLPVFLLLAPAIRKEYFETWGSMKKNAKLMIISKMLVDFSAFIILGLAIASGPISLITALGSSLAPIFIFALTVAATLYMPSLIKEEITSKAIMIKLISITLIAAGIIFINL